MSRQSSGSFPVMHRSNFPATRSQDDDSPFFATVLRGSAFGLLFFILTGLLLLTAVSLVAYSTHDPNSLISPLSLAALLPAMFAGGFVTTKKVGSSPALCGFVCGTLITLSTIAASLALHVLSSSGYSLWQSALLHGIAIVFCLLGSFAGNYKTKPNPKKRRFGN